MHDMDEFKEMLELATKLEYNGYEFDFTDYGLKLRGDGETRRYSSIGELCEFVEFLDDHPPEFASYGLQESDQPDSSGFDTEATTEKNSDLP
jgi:hypothetical protein